jgi:hypothetical protein
MSSTHVTHEIASIIRVALTELPVLGAVLTVNRPVAISSYVVSGLA